MPRVFIGEFLRENRDDIRGNCLEFQGDLYTTRFGMPQCVDILHLDDSNPLATIVADLTKPNDIQSGQFDCIICTQVLHLIYDFEAAVRELHRILKPGGVLLVAVPTSLRITPEWEEYWRFTPAGLRKLLERYFEKPNVKVQGFGNSLTAAGVMRGLVWDEFTRKEREPYDERFTIEVCGRALKIDQEIVGPTGLKFAGSGSA